MQCLKPNEDSQQRRGTRKDSGVELGSLPPQAKPPRCQKQRRLVSVQEATHPHLFFPWRSRHIFTPISHPSALFTSSPLASDGPEQASVLIWLYIHEEGICVPVCTPTYMQIFRKDVLGKANNTAHSSLYVFSEVPSFYLVALT